MLVPVVTYVTAAIKSPSLSSLPRFRETAKHNVRKHTDIHSNYMFTSDSTSSLKLHIISYE